MREKLLKLGKSFGLSWLFILGLTVTSFLMIGAVKLVFMLPDLVIIAVVFFLIIWAMMHSYLERRKEEQYFNEMSAKLEEEKRQYREEWDSYRRRHNMQICDLCYERERFY